MKTRRVYLAAALAVLLAGCSSGTAADRAQKLADDATKAVYNDDMAGLTANMNPALIPTITRAQLGDLADKMHTLGSYQGLTPAGSDTLKSEYDFKAKFDRGTWTVVVRLDGDGKIAAYRVAPTSPGG
jgi:PBP1b-binding outer membrane lipoprotein LpoB